MGTYAGKTKWRLTVSLMVILTMGVLVGSPSCGDLPEVKQRGVLRHLGVPYANFVTGAGDGLDVEILKLFAEHLRVKYEFVETSWDMFISDVSGKKVKPKGDDIEILGEVPIRGDIAASGITILPWRQKVVDFSVPTFPNQVWLVASASASLQPIEPSGDPLKDVEAVKAQLKGLNIMGVYDTCLDPRLYDLDKVGAVVSSYEGTLNEIIPAVIYGKADATLQDVADALLAVEKWPAKVKVVGPVSPMQDLAYVFSKSSPQLRESFNNFFLKCMKDGTYLRLVKKYYPAIPRYYPSFFEKR